MPRPTIRVRAPSRLHFGLLSLGGSAERQFGGVGVMVDAPGLSVVVRPAERLSAAAPLAERVLEFARRFVAQAGLSQEPACHIEVEATPPEHVGLGTGTQLGLAVAAGLAAFIESNDSVAGELAVSEEDAIRWARFVGRGERSAIGTHGFARGGLLVEGGKRSAGAVSSLISRLELPEDWRFVLLIDPSRRGLSGTCERQAFADLPPTTAGVTAALSRMVLVDLLPAAAEGDFELFGESLYQFGHEAGLLFAQRQGGAYAAGVPSELVAWLRSRGVRGVGQSSWGPTIFALTRDQAEAERLVADVERQFSAARLQTIIAAPANRGARVEFSH